MSASSSLAPGSLIAASALSVRSLIYCGPAAQRGCLQIAHSRFQERCGRTDVALPITGTAVLSAPPAVAGADWD
ncbi:MAG TPA: hypothetical protein VFH48_20225 [Chloroflexota bacterium]|nr:hypothetical protein [Chloroflexota bacterium]